MCATFKNEVLKKLLRIAGITAIRLIKAFVVAVIVFIIESLLFNVAELLTGITVRIHGVYIMMLYYCLFAFNLFYFIVFEWLRFYPKPKRIFTIVCCIIFWICSIEPYRWDSYILRPILIVLPIIPIVTVCIREYLVGRVLNSLCKTIQRKFNNDLRYGRRQ